VTVIGVAKVTVHGTFAVSKRQTTDARVLQWNSECYKHKQKLRQTNDN